jgi:hypothetical protein
METIIESIAKGGRAPPSPASLLGAAAAGRMGAAAAPMAIPGMGGVSSVDSAAERAMRHAQSFMDCESVLMHSSMTGPKPTAAPMHAHSPMTAAPLHASAGGGGIGGGSVSSGARRARDLLQGHKLTAVQEDEDQIAQVVIVCEPEGSSLMMGGLHPRGSLYERPVNIEMAKAHHANFRQVRGLACVHDHA